MKHKKQDYLSLLIALFLIASPNLLYVIVGQDIQSMVRKIGFLLFSASLYLIPLFLFSKRVKTYFILLLPFATLSPFNMLFIYLYKRPIDISALGAIFETNIAEASEFLSGFKAVFSIALVAALFNLFLYVFLLRKMQNRLNGKICSAVSFMCLACVVLVSFAPPLWRNEESSDMRLFRIRIASSYPVGIILNCMEYFQWNRFINNRIELMRDVTVNAKRNNVSPGREVYVLIIGEAARYGNFSINGYYRETSPRLRALSNFVSYAEVCATATETRTAIPLLLTRSTASTQPSAFSKPSIITFFKKAGFKTFWISTQGRLGEFNTTARAFAEDADVVLFINKTSRLDSDRVNFDEEILPTLDRILAESGREKMFIVLHTMGSHFRYDLRYPVHFEKFTPSLRGHTAMNTISRSLRDRIMNSYDNSILYTDYFISSVIEKVSSIGTVGTVVYISDHGEDILDDERGSFLHGNRIVTRYVSHVPFFVWVSSLYQSVYPHKAAKLYDNRTERIGGEYFFHSLLDMADITYDGEDLTKSIFSNRLSFHKREIVTPDQKIVDCDSIQ